jgi:hypothetical protein
MKCFKVKYAFLPVLPDCKKNFWEKKFFIISGKNFRNLLNVIYFIFLFAGASKSARERSSFLDTKFSEL